MLIHGSYGLFRCNILHYLQLPVLKKYWEPDCWMWEIHGNPQFTQFNLGHWLGTPRFMTNPQRSHFKDHAIPRWFSPKPGWVSYNLFPFLSVLCSLGFFWPQVLSSMNCTICFRSPTTFFPCRCPIRGIRGRKIIVISWHREPTPWWLMVNNG